MVFSQVENQLNDSLIEKNKLLNINKIRLGFDIFKPIKSSSEVQSCIPNRENIRHAE